MNKTLLALLLTALASSGAQAAERAMRILLVNDDGCDSIGTISLQEKLAAKGFDVWMVAPATNQSGIGSAITFKPNKIFDVKQVTEKRYCFPGTPADAIDFGLLGILKENPPDLVISGVNDAPKSGAMQLNPGTVGAAVRAVRYGYPAIVASIGNLSTADEQKAGMPGTQKYWPDSVDYVVSLLDKLQAKRQPGQPLLPAGSGLSINYPPLAKSAVKGEKFIGNEPFPAPQHSYVLLKDGRAQQVISEKMMMMNGSDTDTGWLNKGYITLAAFDGQWNAPQYEAQYQDLFR